MLVVVGVILMGVEKYKAMFVNVEISRFMNELNGIYLLYLTASKSIRYNS